MKKIFLTGASSGIGRAIAELLCAHGHQVWGTSRDPQRLPSMANFHPAALDLSDPDSITEGFRNALSEAGTFDVVINNAGSGHFGPGEHLTQEQLIAQFQLVVFGQIQILRLALTEMEKPEKGLVINVTSLASRLPVPY
ncbi:MAG: SDR family NAD(P)-dependent oxidoreductase, partial [Verrucomicrobiota bacterium]|nr:SDR family NAD(P)-dependent oxidoreductase [Verrucomicrobiota bacterium]